MSSLKESSSVWVCPDCGAEVLTEPTQCDTLRRLAEYQKYSFGIIIGGLLTLNITNNLYNLNAGRVWVDIQNGFIYLYISISYKIIGCIQSVIHNPSCIAEWLQASWINIEDFQEHSSLKSTEKMYKLWKK